MDKITKIVRPKLKKHDRYWKCVNCNKKFYVEKKVCNNCKADVVPFMHVVWGTT